MHTDGVMALYQLARENTQRPQALRAKQIAPPESSQTECVLFLSSCPQVQNAKQWQLKGPNVEREREKERRREGGREGGREEGGRGREREREREKKSLF